MTIYYNNIINKYLYHILLHEMPNVILYRLTCVFSLLYRFKFASRYICKHAIKPYIAALTDLALRMRSAHPTLYDHSARELQPVRWHSAPRGTNAYNVNHMLLLTKSY